MNWKLGENKGIGANEPKIERIEIREIDKPIIDEFIRSELKKLRKIANNHWWERWSKKDANNFYYEISANVEFEEDSKIAWIHEKHPYNSAFELRQIDEKIIEIGDWEIHIDFDVSQEAIDVIHTEFCRILHQLKELAKQLPRIDNLRNYLRQCGGWNIYQFINVSDWGENSYKFYCYRIKNNKIEFKGGYVEFDESHNPNIWLFTDIENLIEKNYEPLIYKEGN